MWPYVYLQGYIFYKFHIMFEGFLDLVVHHSGRFSDGDTLTWSYDSDRWSYFEIVGIVKEMG